MTELPWVTVETLPTKHDAIRLSQALLADADTGRQLADLVRGRLRNSVSSMLGARYELEVPNWAKPGEFVPGNPGDWLVKVEDVWMVFDTLNFDQVFREDHGVIVLTPRLLE